MKFIKAKTAICVTCAYAVSAFAATEVPQADIPRAEKPQALPAAPPANIKKEPAPALEAPGGNDQLKVLINKFTFTGNTAFDAQQLAILLTDYTGREIGFKELNQATKEITDFYREQGYLLAQAYLPAQDIAGNKVEIAVLEGKLGQLNVHATPGLDAATLEKMAAYKFANSSAVNEKNLVRNVTQLNVLPGVSASASLKPGANVGESDVDINIEAKPRLQGYLGGNTYGNRFTGREVLMAGAQLNNLGGLGDQLSLNLKRSNNSGQRGLDLSYVTPISTANTKLTLGYNYVDYKLGRNLEALDASGDSRYFNVGIDQAIFRDARKGVGLRLGVSHKMVNDEVGFANLNNERHIVGADFGIYTDWLNASGNVSHLFGAAARVGRVRFQDDVAQALDASGAKTKGGFGRFRLSATRNQYFANGVSLALEAEYQRASKNLDSVEKISIGGINRWRRFSELPSLADTGLMLGAELRKRIPANQSLSSLMLVDISPYTFVDLGRGKINQKTSISDNHVRAVQFGLGLDAMFKNTWLLNLAATHHNRDFDGADGENEVRFFGQLIKYF